MAARIEPVLTIGDLDAMPEDGNHYEIIEGELFVSRAPSLSHQQIVCARLCSAELRKLSSGELPSGMSLARTRGDS